MHRTAARSKEDARARLVDRRVREELLEASRRRPCPTEARQSRAAGSPGGWTRTLEDETDERLVGAGARVEDAGERTSDGCQVAHSVKLEAPFGSLSSYGAGRVSQALTARRGGHGVHGGAPCP